MDPESWETSLRVGCAIQLKSQYEGNWEEKSRGKAQSALPNGGGTGEIRIEGEKKGRGKQKGPWKMETRLFSRPGRQDTTGSGEKRT